MTLVTVAKLADLVPGQGRVVRVGARELALFRVGDAVFALDNECCHRGGPLGDGDVSEGCVVCPWHGWRFDLSSGLCVAPAGAGGVARFPVRIAGEDVQIEA